MYLLDKYTDLNDLAYKLASDRAVIENLARFAHMLGFRCCGIDKSGKAAVDFEARTIRFRKDILGYWIIPTNNADDPFDGARCGRRSTIFTISQPQYLIDPKTFVYGEPTLSNMEPSTISTFTAINRSDKEDSISKSFSYQLSDTVSHSTSASFTEGGKAGVKITAGGDAGFKIPFIAAGTGKLQVETAVEFSFSATQGWTNMKSTTDGITDSLQYVGSIPPKSKRVIKLIVTKTESEVTYNANLLIRFFGGFTGPLKGSGARKHKKKDMEYFDIMFGDEDLKKSAFEEIVDMYDHKNNPSYSEWDWDWMKNQYGDWFDGVIEFFRQGVSASVDGKFVQVKGVMAHIIAEKPQPLSDAELQELSAGAHEIALTLTPDTDIHSLRLLSQVVTPSDEIPGGRVLSIE